MSAAIESQPKVQERLFAHAEKIPVAVDLQEAWSCRVEGQHLGNVPCGG